MANTIAEFTPQGGSSITSLSTTKSCTAGSTVVVFHWNSNWASPPTPTCTVGGVTATSLGTINEGAGNPFWRAWYVPNVAGGSTEVAVSGFDSATALLAAYEVLGAPASSPIDVFSSHNAFGDPDIYAASSGQTVAAGSLVVCGYFLNLDRAFTVGSGYTVLTEVENSEYYRAQYQVFASGGSSERGAATLPSGGATTRAFFVAVKEGGGGGSSTGAAMSYLQQLF